ncbi:MAG: septal ring lytic transglycosylase RlpA family protein [Alphaproteobacteria bacterium]
MRMTWGQRHALRVVVMLSTGMIFGCAETEFLSSAVKGAAGPGTNAPQGRGYKVGNPYAIGGVWYYPKVDYEYSETGIASWYGNDFHGKQTANGETFDMNLVSAAHRTLPMPSIVRVTNLDNGRSLLVRVNDRGPFAHGRIIDMSRRGAQLLGFEMQGTAPVKVEIVADASRQLALNAQGGSPVRGEDEPPAPEAAPRGSVVAAELPSPRRPAAEQPAPTLTPQPARPPAAIPVASVGEVSTVPVPGSPRIFIQAGAFSQYDNANRTRAALTRVGDAQITQAPGNQRLFRVRLGPLSNVAAADQQLEAVIAAGYPDARIVID